MRVLRQAGSGGGLDFGEEGRGVLLHQALQRGLLEAQAITHSPDLQPGILLGRFADKDGADAALAQLVQRGVRSARVLSLSAPVTLMMLRVPAANGALRDKLAALKLPPGRLGFAACAIESRKGG